MATSTAEERRVISEDIIKKTGELQAIIERIHNVRFDHTRDVLDIERTIRNLVQEMKRVESDLRALRKTQVEELEATLKLDQIGLPSHFISTSKLSQSGRHLVMPGPKPAPLIHQPASTSALSTSPPSDEDVLSEAEMANLKLMRTESTSTLEGQTPGNKWKSLFKMFQEWKRETNIAQGQFVLSTPAEASLEEEITKVRAAIVSLQHKKSLPESEQQLLSSLQQRLQQLLRARKSMVSSSAPSASPSASSSDIR